MPALYAELTLRPLHSDDAGYRVQSSLLSSSRVRHARTCRVISLQRRPWRYGHKYKAFFAELEDAVASMPLLETFEFVLIALICSIRRSFY
jgi:hypothetical protein